MIYFKENFIHIHGNIMNELYEKLKAKKKRATKEEKKIRKNVVINLCILYNEN